MVTYHKTIHEGNNLLIYPYCKFNTIDDVREFYKNAKSHRLKYLLNDMCEALVRLSNFHNDYFTYNRIEFVNSFDITGKFNMNKFILNVNWLTNNEEHFIQYKFGLDCVKDEDWYKFILNCGNIHNIHIYKELY